jgi:glycosyltransferase involved in cell wall biosynthesis
MLETCAILYINLGPYHVARLRALASTLPGLVAVQVADTQNLYPWQFTSAQTGFQQVTLFSRPFESISSAEQVKAVHRALDDIKPAAIMMAGYFDPVMRAAARWGRKHNVPRIMTTTTTVIDKPRWLPKEVLKGVWCRQHYNALCLPGQRSAAYFGGLGYPESLIWLCGNVVDNAFFQSRSPGINRDDHAQRSKIGLPEHYFLSVSRLSPEKNLRRLLKAYAGYQQRGGKWDLVIVGDGPQEEELKQLAAALKIFNIHFVGWKQYEDLPWYYGFASCFIMPSISEPWALVVNEAMASGLPVLVSRRCGCQPDLAHRGVNGFDFDPYNVEALANLMLRCSRGEMDLAAMGKQSLEIIANYTPETWALSVSDCFRATLQNLRKRR